MIFILSMLFAFQPLRFHPQPKQFVVTCHLCGAQQINPMKIARQQALGIIESQRIGSFEEGWTIRVTGHQMNAIELALSTSECPICEGTESCGVPSKLNRYTL